MHHLFIGGSGLIGSHPNDHLMDEEFLDADAAVVLTVWAECRQLDWPFMASLMRRPAWLFDARRAVDLVAAQVSVLEIWAIGAGEQG
jgi:hypothetical protein